ncbi:hypothetical protein ACIQM0_38550 [Streptomyces sp. NPDC091387]|uniref:hypothetical protein n=1 Tax=Streptomyces sp. NPDC091387 TaxID=3365998 RepID=UPI003801ADC7
MTDNPALEAAYLSVPEIADHHARRKRVADLLSSLPIVEAPELAAQRVADDAVDAYLASGKFDETTNERAHAAYTAAVGAHAVRVRLSALHRDFLSGSTLKGLYEANRDEILANLGAQLTDLLTEAKKHLADLGTARTADEAITAGAEASSAYATLRPLVATLTELRAAQWSAISQGELTGPGSLYARAKNSGHGDVQGVNDDTPAAQFEAMKSQRYTLDHLVWLVQIGTAYIPESVEDVITAQDAFDGRHAVTDGRPMTDISPMVVPIRPTPQPTNPHTTYESERVAKSRAQRSY